MYGAFLCMVMPSVKLDKLVGNSNNHAPALGSPPGLALPPGLVAASQFLYEPVVSPQDSTVAEFGHHESYCIRAAH